MLRTSATRLWSRGGNGHLSTWRLGPFRLFRRIEVQRWAAGRHLERRVEYGILLGTTDAAPAIAVSRTRHTINRVRVRGEAW